MVFSVLIANYNNGRYICEALDSVFAQNFVDWEIIIVDDCSTDDSLKVIEPYLADSRIKLFVNEENRGCGYTKMRCAEEATGIYCGFLDPDDALFPHALETMVNAFASRPEASLINSRDVFCDENLRPIEEDSNSKDISDRGSYLLYDGGGVTHFAVYRNEAYRQTVGLSPEFTKAVDQDLYYLLDEVGKIFFVDDVLYYYRIHKGGISTNNNVIPATYQHFKVMRQAAARRLSNSKFKNDYAAYKKLVAKCDFHISMLDRKYSLAVKNMVAYFRKGGRKEIFAMFGNLLGNPKRVLNTVFKVYRVK